MSKTEIETMLGDGLMTRADLMREARRRGYSVNLDKTLSLAIGRGDIGYIVSSIKTGKPGSKPRMYFRK